MIGLVGESAHAAGGDIQQVAAVFGAVGDAAAGRGAIVNEGHGESWKAAQEMRGEDGAAETAADDYYVRRRIAQKAAFLAESKTEAAYSRAYEYACQ